MALYLKEKTIIPQVGVYDNLEDIDSYEWDSIVPANHFINSYHYNLAIASSRINDCDYRYFIYRDNKGELAAHAIFYSITSYLDIFLPRHSIVARLIARIKAFFPGFLGFVMIECGHPSALGRNITFRPGLCRQEQKHILNELVHAMEAFAREKKASFLVLRDFTEDKLPDFQVIRSEGFTYLPGLGDTFMEVPWSSFDEYLAALKKSYRRAIRSGLKKTEQAGIQVEEDAAYEQYAETLARLWQNVCNHSKEYQREYLCADYFRNLALYCPHNTEVTLFRKGEKIVAFVLYIIDQDILTPAYMGIDYTYNKEAALVFNAYYRIIRTAIKKKLGAVKMGNTTYIPKLRLGARIIPLQMFLKFKWPWLTAFIAYLFRLTTPAPKKLLCRVFKAEHR